MDLEGKDNEGMHLLYFVQYFPPEKASGLPIVMDMIEGFAEHGWDIDVYVPTPTRGITKETRKEYAKKRKEVFCNGKLTIHRMHLYRERTNMLQRTIRYSLFSLQCLIRGLFVPADAIFTGGGPPTQGITGAIIHKWTRKKFIYNPQDLFPDSLIISGKALEQSIVVRIGRAMERFSYQNADVIITITEDMAESIRMKTKETSKVHVVRNWIDTEETVCVERKKNRLFDELNLSRNLFYVVYAGNIGLLQDLDTVINAADFLKQEQGIEFVIFGNGSEEEHIKNLIIERNLCNVKMFPLQPLERVSEVYSLGNISIVSCKKGTGNVGMPSKTWTIMATGTPIIGSFDIESELNKTIQAADCGISIEAGNPKLLASTIQWCYKNPAEVERMGKNARQYAEQNISKQVSVGQYIEFIENVVKGD